jgi:hypothetical protein
MFDTDVMAITLLVTTSDCTQVHQLLMSEKEYVSWCPQDQGSCQHRSSKRIILHYVDCSKTEMRVGEVMFCGEGSKDRRA